MNSHALSLLFRWCLCSLGFAFAARSLSAWTTVATVYGGGLEIQVQTQAGYVRLFVTAPDASSEPVEFSAALHDLSGSVALDPESNPYQFCDHEYIDVDNDTRTMPDGGPGFPYFNGYYIRVDIHSASEVIIHEFPPATFGVTFQLPANTGSRAVLYIATQGGVSIASYTQMPGAAAYSWYVGSLDSNLPVDLQEVVGGFVGGVPGNNTIIDAGNTLNLPPTQTIVRASPTPNPEPPTGAPAAGTATASGPSTSSPGATSAGQPTVDLPHGSSPTFPGAGTLSGAGGATTSDLQAVGNQLVTAIQNADSRAVTSANGITTGINGIIQATNGARQSIDAVAAILVDEQAKTAAHREKLERFIAGEETTEQTTARNTTASNAATAGASASTTSQGVYTSSGGGTHTGLGYTVSAGSAPTLSIDFPAAFGGKTFNLNPFTEERLGPIASWFKAAIAWLVVVTIGSWVWNELDVKAYQASQAQQAKGNTVVGGTGAQLTALTAAAALTTAIVALATALLGWSFGEITLPSIITAMGTNPTSSLPSGVLWMLNQILPVATIITACVARLAWKLYCVPLFAGSMAVCRFIVP